MMRMRPLDKLLFWGGCVLMLATVLLFSFQLPAPTYREGIIDVILILDGSMMAIVAMTRDVCYQRKQRLKK